MSECNYKCFECSDICCPMKEKELKQDGITVYGARLQGQDIDLETKIKARGFDRIAKENMILTWIIIFILLIFLAIIIFISS